MLFVAILIPVIPLIFPFIGCRLKDSHIFISGIIFRIRNHNTILKQTGSSDFICCYNYILSIRCDTLYQCIESCRCSGHSDNYWHSLNAIFRASFKELLHNRSSASGFTSLHSTVCFVNDKIQTITLVTGRIS